MTEPAARKTRRRGIKQGGTTVVVATVVAAAGVLAAGGTASAGGAARTAVSATAQSWVVAGHDIANTHDQPLETAISAANASQLVPKWTFTTDGDVTATPTVASNHVYFPDMGGMLWALTDTGKVIWSNPVSTYTGIAGDISRDSPAIDGNELITGDGWDANKLNQGARVFAVNRTTGALLWSTVVDTNIAAILTGSPTVYNGVVYVGVSSYEEGLAATTGYKCCTFRGAVVALNATTGQILWKTYTVPSNNGGGDTNKPGFYAGGAVWGSSPAVDPSTGMLYVTTGNDYAVPKGVCIEPGQKQCKKPVTKDYFDSILGLSLSTGAVDWGYRTEEGDVSTGACTTICGPDYDFGSMPNLVTFTNPATHATQTLVGAGQKSGIYWALDPATGKLDWKRRVGPGGGGGGIEWGSATDGTAIYTTEADTKSITYTMGGSGPFAGEKITYSSWAAIDPATGKILWQTPDPQAGKDDGFVSVANGVVYVGSEVDPGNNMYALNASNGTVLWSFASGGQVRSGAAIVGPKIYWGSGYRGGDNTKFYAFGLPAARATTSHP